MCDGVKACTSCTANKKSNHKISGKMAKRKSSKNKTNSVLKGGLYAGMGMLGAALILNRVPALNTSPIMGAGVKAALGVGAATLIKGPAGLGLGIGMAASAVADVVGPLTANLLPAATAQTNGMLRGIPVGNIWEDHRIACPQNFANMSEFDLAA